MYRLLIVILFFLTACAPTTPVDVDATPQIITLYVAPAVEEWIPFVYNCAARTPEILVSRTPNIAEADISLRLRARKDGEMLAYQIGEIELLIVSNAANPISELTRPQVAAIFEGKIRSWAQVGGYDGEIQIWVYGQDDDLQVMFNKTVLDSSRLSSLARQATSQPEMREVISKDSKAIGIISATPLDEKLHNLYAVGQIPMLAIPMEEPQGDIFSLLSCLQGG